MTEYTVRSQRLQSAVIEGEAEKAALRKARDDAVDGLRESNKAIDALNSEYEQVCAQLRDVGDDRRRSKQEERVAEAIQNMQRIFSGCTESWGICVGPSRRNTPRSAHHQFVCVLYVLSSCTFLHLCFANILFSVLIIPLSQAVTVTAGKLMDSIVVDTKHVAAECIRYSTVTAVRIIESCPLHLRLLSACLTQRLVQGGEMFATCRTELE